MAFEDMTQSKPVDPGYGKPAPILGGPQVDNTLPTDGPPDWLTKPGPDRPRVGGDSTRAQWAFDPKIKKLVQLEKQKALLNMKINLGSPLIVKTKTGEVLAGPGDVIGEWGKHQVMMSKDMFVALIGDDEYNKLLAAEMLKVVIAKRADDGLLPYSEAELGERKIEIGKVIEAKGAAEQAVDPNDLNQRVQVVDSKNGPPTAFPDEYATIVPGPMLPIPVGMPPEIPPGGGQVDPATGASAGSPGAYTPSGGSAPADFAALSGITADPTTAWTSGQYVVLGDGSEAYWDGLAWAVGRAPVV